MTMATIESRLAELGITLPEPPAPVATYVPFTIHQGVVTISGQLPLRDGALLATGKLGAEVSVEAGKAAARACFINVLAQLKRACGGDLDRVRRVVRLGGFIASHARLHPACAGDERRLGPRGGDVRRGRPACPHDDRRAVLCPPMRPSRSRACSRSR